MGRGVDRFKKPNNELQNTYYFPPGQAKLPEISQIFDNYFG